MEIVSTSGGPADELGLSNLGPQSPNNGAVIGFRFNNNVGTPTTFAKIKGVSDVPGPSSAGGLSFMVLSGSSGMVEQARVSAAGLTASTMSLNGSLTVSGATVTVTGTAFSVGGSTLAVASGRVGMGVAAPAAALDVQTRDSDYAAAVFRNAGGVAVATVTAGGVVAGLQTWSYSLFDPQGIQVNDNIPAIIANRLGAVTLTEVWCESADGGGSINLSVGGTSILNSNLSCGITGSTAGSPAFSGGANVYELPANSTIKHLTIAASAGATTSINVVIKYLQR
jgi:hypothetical protein